MDFIDGISLDEEAPTINEIAVISARIAEGLDHAHQHRIVHRDIKPANIMVTRDDLFGAIDRVVILDFGTASITTATTPTTSTAEFMGTIAYTAPEIIRGHSATGRADQYSLAATVYRLITGHTPSPASRCRHSPWRWSTRRHRRSVRRCPSFRPSTPSSRPRSRRNPPIATPTARALPAHSPERCTRGRSLHRCHAESCPRAQRERQKRSTRLPPQRTRSSAFRRDHGRSGCSRLCR